MNKTKRYNYRHSFFCSSLMVGQDRSENPLQCHTLVSGTLKQSILRKENPGVINEGPVPVGAVA